MKTITLLLIWAAGMSAQSLAVTSPANGSVVTWGFRLTATPTALPSLAQVRFYVDNRLECIGNALWLGSWSCPKMMYATYSDEQAATIYAEAYNAAGTLLATSTTNTFRINNGGLNAVTTFNFGGLISRGGTVSGSGTVTMGQNATVSGLSFLWNWDGLGSSTIDTLQSMFGSNATLNLSNGHFTVPIITGHTGSLVYASCTLADGVGCTPSSDLPSGLTWGTQYYLSVCGPNCVGLATTLANAQAGTVVIPTTRGNTPGSYTQMYYIAFPWISNVTGSSYQINTTYFRDGRHRHTLLVQASGVPSPPPGTFSFPSGSITISTGTINSVNFPLVQGQAVTVASSGSLPPQWSGTMYAVVQDANDFCLASSVANAAAGVCIAPLTNAGSGTMTVSFNIPNTFWLTNGGSANRVYGTDVNWLTFSNGAVPMALRTKYSKISGIAGDTFSLAPYVLNCDGSTMAISASLPVYSSADSTRATVSSTGVVTLGSTSGHTLISVVDSTHLRETLVDVEVRNDRTTYKHYSKGFGIINSYDPAKSVAGIVPFGGDVSVLTHTPFPIKYLKPAFTAMGGAFQGSTITPSYGAVSYSDWSTKYWGQPITSSWSKLYWQQQSTLAAGILFYGLNNDNCHGNNAYRLTQDLWRQQAMSTMLNDLAPYTLGHEHCDEMTTRWSNAMRPRGDMGSGQDGLGNSTLGGQTAGLTSIVVTGCPAIPCQGTATVYLRSWPSWMGGGGYSIQISGATTHNLNGPYQFVSPVYADDNPIGQYMVSAQITTFDVLNGTYNSSTDPNLVITENQEGVDYALLFGGSTLGTAATWSSALTSFVCASNVCTIHWTSTPLIDGQTCHLAGFTTPGINGYYRCDKVDANTFTVRLASVANGTYNSTTDPSATFDGMANFPQTFVSSMFSTYITGAHAPFDAPLIGGFGAGQWSMASWDGPTSLSDVVMNNMTATQYDRYGPLNYSYRDFFRQGQLKPFVDGSLPINLRAVDKPVLYQTELNGETCDHFVATLDCKTDILGADLISTYPQTGGRIFVSNMIPWIMPNGVGSKPYQYLAGIGLNRTPPAANPSGSQNFQAAPDEVDQYPDQWLALVSVNLAIQHEDKYLLQPPLSSPDVSNGPGPAPLVECQSHTSAAGNALLCVNLSEEQQVISIDTSIINLGGPMRRWTLSAFGDTVTSLPPSTTTDSVTLPYGQAFLYVSQAAGAADDLKTINIPITPGYGASNAVLEIHYYPGDQNFQRVDCGTGACPPIPVNLHNLDVYVRKRFTKSDGTPVAAGDLERVPAQ